MSETLRGVIVFVTVLVTIGIWAPLRNQPQRLASGGVVTETYFGVFGYLTLKTETREPEYHMEWIPNYKKLAVTGAVTAVLWVAVGAGIRRRRSKTAEGEPSSQ